MEYFAAAVLFIFLHLGTTSAQGNSSVLVTLLSDLYLPDIMIYEGDPSDGETMQESHYTFSYPSTKALSIAADVRQRDVFIMRNVPGDIVRLSDTNRWLNSSDQRAIIFHSGVSDRLSQIAVDGIHGNVYWTDGGFHWIVMQSTRTNDTSMYRVILHDLQEPFGLAVDPINGYIFWTELGDSPRIKKATLSGENPMVLVHDGLIQPAGIALDFAARRVYWVDGVKDTIDFMDYDGQNREMFRRINGAVFISLILYQDILLVADFGENRILSFNKVAQNLIEIWGDLPGRPTDITVFEDLSQTHYEDVCADEVCEHLCVKTSNGSKCLCKNGYHIISDGKTCEEDSTKWRQEVVFALDGEICTLDVRFMATSSDATYSCPITFEGTVGGIAIDMSNEILFYFKNNVLYRRAISNSSEESVAESTGTIGGIVFDWLNNNLYWTEEESDRIMMISLETRVSSSVFETPSPMSLTADPYNSTLFWIANHPIQTIKSAKMDGSEVKDLMESTTLSLITDLTIDIRAGRIYWLNSGDIKSMRTDGTDVQNEISTSLGTNHIVNYRDYIIWNDDSSLRSYTKSDLAAKQSYSLQGITSLSVYDIELQRRNKGPCWGDNGGCEHTCIPDDDSRVCRCQFGYTLQTDEVTCASELITNNYFLLSDSTHQQIYQVSLSNGEVRALDIEDIGNVLGITYQEETQKIYWADISVGIKSATLNSRIATTVLRIYTYFVVRLEIDPGTNNIYYTAKDEEANMGYIAVYNEEMDIHRKLIPDLVLPKPILLKPSKGVMYWADTGPGKIFESNMDGTNTREIMSDLVWPNGLALDDSGNKLYYIDGYTDIIGFVDLNGLGAGTLATDANADLGDIVLNDGYLYYTGFNRFYVTRMNVAKPSDTTKLAPSPEFGRLDALYIHSVKEPINDACGTNNGQCSQLCLPTITGRTCACGDSDRINPDGRTCESDILCSDVIKNGGLDPSCLRYEDALCTFSCNDNYKLAVDNNIIKCETGGIWNISTDDACQEFGCEEDVHNGYFIGYFIGDCSRHVGTQCDFRCDDGYRKTTENIPVCLSSAEWSEDLSSVCEAITCPVIPNGALNDRCDRTVGALCSFSCDEEYTAQSDELTLTCLTSGDWSSSLTSLCLQSKTTSPPDKMSTETIVYISVGAGAFVLLITVVIVIMCVMAKRKQDATTPGYIGHQNPVFQYENPYSSLQQAENYLHPLKPPVMPPTMCTSGYNVNGEGGYASLNEVAIVGMSNGADGKTGDIKRDKPEMTDNDSGDYQDNDNTEDYIRPTTEK